MGYHTVESDLINQKIANFRVVAIQQNVMDPILIWMCTSEILYIEYLPIGIMAAVDHRGMIAIGNGVIRGEEDHAKMRLLQASALVALLFYQLLMDISKRHAFPTIMY